MTVRVSNADLLHAVEGIRGVTNDHETRLKAAEQYIIAQTAVADYVARYGTPEQKESSKAAGGAVLERPNLLASTIVKLFALFTIIIGLITAIIQATK